MSEVVYLTKKGLDDLEKQLELLKSVERPKVTKMIGEAKAFGDLSENSEYDAAKIKEAQLEAKIFLIEEKLKNFELIDESKIDVSKVSVGTKVKVLDIDFGDEDTYKIMGATEANPDNGSISNESPIGKALLNKKVGETAEVETPGGLIKLKVLEITL